MGNDTTKDEAKRKVIVNKPLNWSQIGLSEQAKSLRFPEDEEGNLWAQPVIVLDTNPIVAFGVATPEANQINPWAKIRPVNNQGNIAADVSSPSLPSSIYNGAMMTEAFQFVMNGTAMEPVRTPSVFKSALIAAAGSTAIWTAGVGKKWRLMGMQITLVNGTTAAAASLLKVLDVAADTGVGVQICGAAMGAVGTSSIIFNSSWGNGITAAATNTALNINLSSVLAVAGVFVQVWGTEE
jgi:hypothetical protein